MASGCFVVVQGRLGVRDRLHQRDVGADNITQGVLRITGRCRSQDFYAGALRFDLAPQLLQISIGVLDRVAFESW